MTDASNMGAAASARDTSPARRGDWMQTFSGRRFWPLDPRPEDVAIEDIAHSLSLQTRYAGHCLRFYSVAEHCVLMARAAPAEHARRALLHDAAEAYLVDLPRPVKRFLLGYGPAEIKVMGCICLAFGLDGFMPETVKALDNRILMDERAQNMRPTGEVWNYGGATEPLGVTLQFWSPERAEREFLTTFAALTILTPES